MYSFAYKRTEAHMISALSRVFNFADYLATLQALHDLPKFTYCHQLAGNPARRILMNQRKFKELYSI